MSRPCLIMCLEAFSKMCSKCKTCCSVCKGCSFRCNRFSNNIAHCMPSSIMYPENWTGNEDRLLCPRESAEAGRRRAMSTQRKHSSAACKARVAFEALKGLKTVNELASTYGVHPTQMAPWQHRLHKEVPDIFSARRAQRAHDHEAF